MRCLPILLFCFSQWTNLIGPSHKKMKLWTLPKIEGSILKYWLPPLWPTHMGERRTTICRLHTIPLLSLTLQLSVREKLTSTVVVSLHRSKVSEFEVGSFFFFKSDWFSTLIIRFANFELAKEKGSTNLEIAFLFLFFFIIFLLLFFFYLFFF
jgi:hypothetical protein